MGIVEPIAPGGLFPRHDAPATLSVAALDRLPRVESNHPSFGERFGAARPPGMEQLQSQLDAGFALLFADAAAAEAFLGGRVHPAPLGNVSKCKPDGTRKHRVIQDLRANRVNDAVTLGERQVLPRGVDHAKDVAQLLDTLEAGEVIATLVLDFKDAFNSVPLHESEQRFNCASLDDPLVRDRPPCYDDEPRSGRFLVWRVLGFGGKPNPLVYSRAASFACRSAQALLGPQRHRSPDDFTNRLALARSQLYVDDTSLAVAGEERKIGATIDLYVLWLLLLGVPIAWAKGELTFGSTPHRWIGIEFEATGGGVLMMLPPSLWSS